MKKGKAILCWSMAFLLTAGLTACGQEAGHTKQAEEASQTESGPSGTEPGTEGSRDILGTGAQTLFGRITDIRDIVITLELAEQTSLPKEEERPEKAGGPKTADKNMPGSGEAPDPETDKRDIPAAEPEWTGEFMTLSVTAETIITVDGETAAIEDLSAGDFVTVFMEEDIVNSISAGELGPGR